MIPTRSWERALLLNARPAPLGQVTRLARARRTFRRWWRRPSVRVVIAATAFTLIAAGAMFVVEQSSNEQYGSLWDALWWALVTMTTTGYGDVVPKSFPGRLLGVLTMFTGLGLVTVITALVASAFVTEGLKEARGLEAIKSRGHVIIAGWNWGGQRVVQGLTVLNADGGVPVVLVNQLPEETVNELLYEFRDLDVRFVRGDFTQETVLERANVSAARAAILLADSSSPTSTRADERTIIACLSMKHLNPDIHVTGELLDASSAPHLQRAGADDVVVSGEFNAFLLAASAASPGVTHVLRALADFGGPARLRTLPVPARYVRSTFRDLAGRLEEADGLLAIGIVTEAKGLTLADVLSAESTPVDEFIQRKFEEAGFGLGASMLAGVQVNPPQDYVLKAEDQVVVIGGKEA